MSAGKEVTVHEKAINDDGFNGFGYAIIDPETGVGGYLIEGKGSGGTLFYKIGYAFLALMQTLGLTASVLPFILIAAYLGVYLLALVVLASMIALYVSATEYLAGSWTGFLRDIASGIALTMISGFFTGFTMIGLIIALILTIMYAIIDVFLYPSRQ